MNNRKPRLYPAHITGILTLIAAFVVFVVHPWISAGILFSYIVLCVAACFFPETNFLGPVISRGMTGRPLVSLTFDDGPSDSITRSVLELLEKHQIKATFFVSGVNAENHPDIIKEIVKRGHEIGNHSFHHFPFLMLKGRRRLISEISEAQSILYDLGIETKAFRPPVGIINPALAGVLHSLDLICVTFSCRALDAGNRRIKSLSNRILKKVKADDIILLHDVSAGSEVLDRYLMKELEMIILGIKDKGLQVVPLVRLIGREIMTSKDVSGGRDRGYND